MLALFISERSHFPMDCIKAQHMKSTSVCIRWQHAPPINHTIHFLMSWLASGKALYKRNCVHNGRHSLYHSAPSSNAEPSAHHLQWYHSPVVLRGCDRGHCRHLGSGPPPGLSYLNHVSWEAQSAWQTELYYIPDHLESLWLCFVACTITVRVGKSAMTSVHLSPCGPAAEDERGQAAEMALFRVWALDNLSAHACRSSRLVRWDGSFPLGRPAKLWHWSFSSTRCPALFQLDYCSWIQILDVHCIDQSCWPANSD